MGSRGRHVPIIDIQVLRLQDRYRICLAAILLITGLESCAPVRLHAGLPDHTANVEEGQFSQAGDTPTQAVLTTRTTLSTPTIGLNLSAGRLHAIPQAILIHTRTPNPTATQARDALTTVTTSVPAMNVYLTGLRDQNEFSGAVLVSQGGRLLLDQGYGFSDRARQAPISPKTRFDIGSLTKAFTAAAVLTLQVKGRLDITERICAYLDTCPAAWQEITLEQLLTHTSGIPDYANSGQFGQIDDEDCTPAQIIPLFQNLPLDFAPGTQWRYSNSGYVLLGAAIEKASGKPYDAYLKETLFGPLGMQDTGMDRDDGTVAKGYLDSQTQAGKMNSSSLYSAGGLYSTVDDLNRWYRGLASGNLLPSALAEQMLSPQVQTGDGSGRNYGYGWFLDGATPPGWEAHGGRVGGFSAEIIHRNRDDALAIVLSNQANVDAEGIGFKLLAMLPED